MQRDDRPLDGTRDGKGREMIADRSRLVELLSPDKPKRETVRGVRLLPTLPSPPLSHSIEEVKSQSDIGEREWQFERIASHLVTPSGTMNIYRVDSAAARDACRYQGLEYVLEWYSVCAPLVHVQCLQLSVEFRPSPLFFAAGDIERAGRRKRQRTRAEERERERTCVLQLGTVCRYSRKGCLMTTISIRELYFPAAPHTARPYPARRAPQPTGPARKSGI